MSNMHAQTWIKTMLLTAAVYPLTCFGIGLVLNTIAIFQGSLAAIPFGTMVVRAHCCSVSGTQDRAPLLHGRWTLGTQERCSP